MRIAVLMSSYNGERYIEEQIESILSQDCDGEVMLLVRDDGSTDNTLRILEQYQKAGKLQWYTGENLRPAKSFLHLAASCPDCDFYAFADQDDRWHPDKLRAGIAQLQNAQGPAMSFANARLVDGSLLPLERNVYTAPPHHDYYSVLCGGGILGCTIVFNRQLAKLIRQYSNPEKLIMHDSYIATLCTLFDGEIFYDPQPHMDYRQHGNNAVGAQWTKWAALKNRIGRITKPQKVSIAQMAQSILDQEPAGVDPKKLHFLQQVADYRRSLFSAIRLACSRRPTYNSRNMALTMRLAILLRNR